jgi:hypothetical protein
MKNKFIIPSLVFACTCIGNIEAAQSQKEGYESLYSNHFSLSHDFPIKSRDLNTTTITTDPYELDEKHVEFFGKKQFQDAASALIGSAICGHADNRAFLYDIDSKSLEHISSKLQLEENFLYYENKLIPMVVNHMKVQYEKIEDNKNKPVILYWEK